MSLQLLLMVVAVEEQVELARSPWGVGLRSPRYPHTRSGAVLGSQQRARACLWKPRGVARKDLGTHGSVCVEGTGGEASHTAGERLRAPWPRELGAGLRIWKTTGLQAGRRLGLGPLFPKVLLHFLGQVFRESSPSEEAGWGLQELFPDGFSAYAFAFAEASLGTISALGDI